MENNNRLRSVLAQIIEIDGGVLLKRGNTELLIKGEQVAESLNSILYTASQEGGAAREALYGLFPSDRRNAVTELIEKLMAKRLLIPVGDESESHAQSPASETSTDLFYWDLGIDTNVSPPRSSKARITILGVNSITRGLVQTLVRQNWQGLEVVDFSMLRNIGEFGVEDSPDLEQGAWPKGAPQPKSYGEWSAMIEETGTDLIVAASDFGGPQLMLDWNEYCVGHGIPFMPILLNRGRGTVGPIIVPGECACYECLQIRENANMEKPDLMRKIDAEAFKGQLFNASHPAMTEIVSNIAAMELTKFLDLPWAWKKDSIIDINLLTNHFRSSTVWKVPRCSICGSGSFRPALDITQSDYEQSYELVKRLEGLSGGHHA